MTKESSTQDNLTLYQTRDGSHTLESAHYDATYHSIFGAIEESIHVFITAGLDYHRNQETPSTQLNILEIGLGTGLNVWLAALWAQQHQIPLNIHSLEKHPLDESVTSQLNFNQCLPNLKEDQQSLLQEIHHSKWEEATLINTHTTLTKYHCDVLTRPYPTHHYDVIFFDAFAPNTQPELWTESFHQKLYHSLKANGVLTTYCAKGVVKRMLKGIGYHLDQLSGPHRKHEMTRALKQS